MLTGDEANDGPHAVDARGMMSATSAANARDVTDAPNMTGAKDTRRDALSPARIWRGARALGRRVFLAYVALYVAPSLLYSIVRSDTLSDAMSDAWAPAVRWVGAHLFGLPNVERILVTGSGDTTFDYVLVACSLMLAGAIALLWTARGTSASHDARIEEAVRVATRYALGFTMLSYGLAKVYKSQFPLPDAGRLMEPYGQSSPMGLLWTFMGASTPYTVFAGIAECVGGLLLFVRRTTTLGALILTVVLSNVVLLNFSYDVCVKLYSSHLLVMALFLAAPDARRLFDLLVLRRATSAPRATALFRRRGRARAALLVKTVLVAFVAFQQIKDARETWHSAGDAAPAGELDGLYEVERFVRAGVDIPPLFRETQRWRRVAVSPRRLVVQRVSDDCPMFNLTADAAKHTLTLVPRGEAEASFVLAYTRVDANRVILEGAVKGEEVHVEMRRTADATPLLTTRGFHWISEYPFNR